MLEEWGRRVREGQAVVFDEIDVYVERVGYHRTVVFSYSCSVCHTCSLPSGISLHAILSCTDFEPHADLSLIHI